MDADIEYKRKCRQASLEASLKINPLNMSFSQNKPPVPSVRDVLSDADKIYEWLIKDL